MLPRIPHNHNLVISQFSCSSSSSESCQFRPKMAHSLPLKHLFCTTILAFSALALLSKAELDAHYYDRSCPQLEKIIKDTVVNASKHDPKVPARILRMFFHDCFIRGCDASVLLDSTPTNKAEKDGPPNISVRSFYVIDQAKAKLEKECPHIVACADILAIAARDVVALSGGPSWDVLKGRKDGRVSKASDTRNLPAPTSNMSQLIQSFASRGLDIKDLVTLSGGHTLGFSHCSSFEARLRNFSLLHDVDPSLDSEFAQDLKKKCPEKAFRGHNAGHFMDSTASVFDNDYYKRLLAGQGLFISDQAIVGDYRTRRIVEAFAKDQTLFFNQFVASMLKLGNVGVSQDGEVRRDCKVVN